MASISLHTDTTWVVTVNQSGNSLILILADPGSGGDDKSQVPTNSRRAESFLLRNGSYDWSRDQAGVDFLRAAQDYEVPYVTFFINAAPSHIATNGAACGWDFEEIKTEAFAEYITAVLEHWVEEGIDIKYISPMNEPDNSRPFCEQEGMAVAPELRTSIFKTLREKLDRSSASLVQIIGDETSRITSQAVVEDPIWLSESSASIAGIAVHDYDFVTDAEVETYYQSVKELKSNGKEIPIKFSEICCSTTAGNGPGAFREGYDPTMTNALVVARYIWQFLTIAQAESFDWWTAVAELPCSPTIHGGGCATAFNSTAGWNSGLISIDPNYNSTKDYGLYLTKRAWMMKHFAHFHRPGSRRYDLPHGDLPFGVNAFVTQTESASPNSPCQATWNILLFNNQTTAFDISLKLPKPASHVLEAIKTDAEFDWKTVRPKPRIDDKDLQLHLPAETLLSLQLCVHG